jgi:hypothetical protein
MKLEKIIIDIQAISLLIQTQLTDAAVDETLKKSKADEKVCFNYYIKYLQI